MPSEVFQLALYSVASFVVGGMVAWRVLGRGRRGYSRKLAQELTESVHDRCSAYRSLENRIDTVIADFDRREAELRSELAAGGVQAAPAPSAAAEIAPEPTVTEFDALSWMDTCDGPVDPTLPSEPTLGVDPALEVDPALQVHPAFQVDPAFAVDAPLPTEAATGDAGATAFVGLPVAEEPAVEETANVVDQITRQLQIVQRQKTEELESHRGRIEGLEGRIRSLETTLQTLLQRERAPAPQVPVSSWAQSIQELREKIARSDRELATWHAQHEEWARERRASIESVREIATRLAEGWLRNPEAEARATSLRARAEELAREAASLQAAIARREIGPKRAVTPEVPATAETQSPPAVHVPARPVQPADASEIPSALPRTVASEPKVPAVPRLDVVQEAPKLVVEVGSTLRGGDVSRGPTATPEPRTVDLASLVDSTPGPIPATVETPAGGSSQISQLMRNLEVAQGEAEKYRKKLQEQSTQFTAAYAMLDRIRPFVQALENEYAAHGQSRPS